MQQSEIIDFLSRSEAYHLGEEEAVLRIDTHISIVFLAGKFAYKLKRATRLPFVDFTTLQSRHYFCQQELEINSQLAPHLYISLVPVSVDEGKLNIEGKGHIVDWLVKMHRFDQQDLFDQLCEKGQLDQKCLERLADQIVTCYEHAKICHSHFGGHEGIVRAFAGHYLALDNVPDHLWSSQTVDQLKTAVGQEIAKQAERLDQRRDAGLVRHCHGDLHLRNICLFEDEITLFDAIEFEPDYANIDQLYDLSFLLMDLCHRGRVDWANMLLNRYMGLTGDVAGYHVLGLFLSSRALIRAHVDGVASKNQASADARIALEEEAQTYMSQTLAFLQPVKPCLMAIAGLSGSGKSTLARAIAPYLGRKPGAYIARTDMIRKRLMGVRPHVKLDESAYSPKVTRNTYACLYKEVSEVLKAGFPVIVDGVFAREGERRKVEKLAADLGVDFCGIWLQGNLQTLEHRVENRLDDVSDADVDVVRSQAGYDCGIIDWHVLDAEESVEKKLQKSLGLLDAGLAQKSE